MNIYILLQGLFFLEYKSNPNRLFVTAPIITGSGLRGHAYRMGNPDNVANLAKIPPNTVIDWSGQLQGGWRNSFPSEMHQFYKIESGTGDITDDATQFAFRLILQYPVEIYALRKGDRTKMRFIPGVLQSSIDHHSSPFSISLVTCLEYQGLSDPSGSGTNRCHFYAESYCAEDVSHVNSAYMQCGRLFSGGFNLQLDEDWGDPPKISAKGPAEDDPRLADLKGRDCDEDDLSEFFALATNIKCPPPHVAGVNVANCGQFGVLNP